MGLPLQVFLLGLLTVFLVLLVVVATGHAIIWIVNRFPGHRPGTRETAPATKAAIRPGHMAAIVAAVRTHSRGKARIDSIEPL